MSAPTRAAGKQPAVQHHQTTQSTQAGKTSNARGAGKPQASSPKSMPSPGPLPDSIFGPPTDVKATTSSALPPAVASTALAVDEAAIPALELPQQALGSPLAQGQNPDQGSSSGSVDEPEHESARVAAALRASLSGRSSPGADESRPATREASPTRYSGEPVSPQRPLEMNRAGHVVIAVEDQNETHELSAKLATMYDTFTLLQSTGEELALRVESLVATQISFGAGNEATVSNPLEQFKMDFDAFRLDFKQQIDDMTERTPDVLAKIKALNTKVHHSSQRRLVVLGQFVTFWNKISSISDEVKWLNDLIDSTINILPDLRTFLLKVNHEWFKVHSMKTYKCADKLSATEKDRQNPNVEGFLATFASLNEEALAYEERIKGFIRTLRHVKPTKEQLEEYANHTEDQIIANRNNLEAIARKINGKADEIRTVLVAREWEAICSQLEDFATQITRFATTASVGLLNAKMLYDWGLYSKKVEQGSESKELKASVVYDPALFQ